MAEASYTTMTAVSAISMSAVSAVGGATQLQVEKQWEQQLSTNREVRGSFQPARRLSQRPPGGDSPWHKNTLFYTQLMIG